MSWQARGEGEGGIQKGETKGSNCLLSPQSPSLPLNPKCPTGILEGHGFESVREKDFCFVLQPSQNGILAWSNFASHLP